MRIVRTTTWQDIAVSGDTSLREGLRVLDVTAAQILLVVTSDDVLVGTVTDGDIRRALLAEQSLDSPLSLALNAEPISGSVDLSSTEAIAIIRRLSIHALPLVDDLGRVRDVIFDGDVEELRARTTSVVVMAGGRGTRLRPLTDSVPKPLVRIGGMPIAEATVRRMQRQGFRNIWFSVHYRASDIEEHFGDGSGLGVAIDYLRESEPLGTVGAVRLLPSSARDCVLVVNGDLVTAMDFGSLVDAHLASGAAATMGVVEHLTELPFGVIREEGGVLLSIEEKPRRADLVSAGVAVLSHKATECIPVDGPCDMPDLVRMLVSREELVSVARLDDYWLDIGTPEALSMGKRQHSLDISTSGESEE